jgi:hypothetical protein
MTAILRWLGGACLLLAGAPLALAQTGAVPSGDGLVARSLLLIEPDTPGPLTARERLHLYLCSVGAVPLFATAADAGLEQWFDTPKEWGQGAAGYGRRFADSLSYGIVRQTLMHGTSALFHEDNRYFAAGKRGMGPRMIHAIAASMVARGENGAQHVSISAIAGVAGAGLISSLWEPPCWQRGAVIGRTIGLTFAGQAGVNVLREFLPGLLRRSQKPSAGQP